MPLWSKVRRYRVALPTGAAETSEAVDIAASGFIHGLTFIGGNPSNSVTATIDIDIDTRATATSSADYLTIWTLGSLAKNHDDYIFPTQGSTGGTVGTGWPDGTPIPIDSGNETIVQNMSPARLTLTWSGAPGSSTTSYVDLFIEEL